MINAYKDYWKRYFDFSGKTSVGGYWWVVLCNFIISFVIGFIAELLKFDILSTIWSLATFIPGIAIFIRRLRDGNHSFLNILWLLLPIIGWIIIIIKLCK